jgi:hypothetical protein
LDHQQLTLERRFGEPPAGPDPGAVDQDVPIERDAVRRGLQALGAVG